MVYTSRMVAFSRQGNDELTDIIPIKEIITVKEIEVYLSNSFIDREDDAGADDACAFEINTLPDGYNSGRSYKMRAASKKSQGTIIEDLTRLSAREREKSEAKSKFKKSQDKVAAVVNSNFVQRFLALLIITVLFLCLPWFKLLFK
jgi:uncharacterized protein YfcZ (UPF0381/DUF406 family)